jgi:hypothetical protein
MTEIARSVLLAVAIMIAARLQTSAQVNEARMIFGQGMSSCGTWTQARQQRSVTAGLSAQWVAGYLSGINMDPASPNALAATDFDGLMGWIDNYCISHPLEVIANAAYQLEMVLRSRAQGR